MMSVSVKRVSTHSRAEAAALFNALTGGAADVSTHSRAEAAAPRLFAISKHTQVSTHSRAEAAAYYTLI